MPRSHQGIKVASLVSLCFKEKWHSAGGGGRRGQDDFKIRRGPKELESGCITGGQI